MREATILNQKGFQSVDEDPDLMAAYPPKPVDFNGEDICSLFQAGQNPSTLGRSLRKVLFGDDGLTMDMMGSKNSPGRKEAPADYNLLFESKNESIVFFCLVSYLIHCLVDFLPVAWRVVLLYFGLSSCSLYFKFKLVDQMFG